MALLMTGLCCLSFALMGQDVVLQLFSKLISEFLILYIVSLSKNKFCYYYNLHLSKAALLTSYVIIDLFIFGCCLWIVGIMT